MSLAREYGAAVDLPRASTKRARRAPPTGRSRVCKRIYDLAIERYGIEPTDLIFDCLTFPLGAGTGETCDATASRRSRRSAASRPSSRASSTILGLSNVSFGFKPAIRHVLNSVFLHECREAGLDAAIVHAARIMPMHKIDDHVREVTLDLIYDRRRDGYDPLTELMALFEGVEAAAVEREDRSGWPIEERLKHRIIDGDRDGLEADLEEQLASLPALAIVNDVLLDGMKVVGDLFGAGEMQLPFVLQSAETMKTAVAYLEPHMEKADAGGKGTARDRHREGRRPRHRQEPRRHHPHQQRLRGPQHRDQGAAVGVRRQGRRRSNADAIGMSGLLVKSTLIMRENLEELNERGLVRHAGDPRRRRAHPHLRRARPARGLRGPPLLRQGRVRGPPHHGHADGRQAHRRRSTPTSAARSAAATSRAAPRSDAPADDEPVATDSDVATDVPVFTPPFLGSRVAKGISLDDIAGYINETALFRNQWQFRPDKTRSETDADFKERIRATLRAELDIGQGRRLAGARGARGATSP